MNIFESIPIVDCSKITGPLKDVEIENLNYFAKEIGESLSGIGFVYLSNHGIDLNKIERVYEVSKQFFDMSPEIKTKMRKPPGAISFHGYAGPGDELLNESKPNVTELREFYDVTGHIESNDEARFPSEVPGFKDAFDEARIVCAGLADKLLRCIAIYLGLTADELVKRHTNLHDRKVPTQTVMRSSMYSPLKNVAEIPDGAVRCGEHCDWHTITLLFQDMIGGLEVRGTTGKWVSATPIKDAILLNSGQLLEIYSGGKLPATVNLFKMVPPIEHPFPKIPEFPHRVRILREHEEKLRTKPRQSLVYCPSPDGFEEVEPLVPVLEELNGRVRSIYGPQSYNKLNAHEWVHQRHSAAASY